MTIKEVEEKTGIVRSSVRFYEKEKLIHPVRNNRNGYREYTEEDVKNIKKIAYLRTLGISLENIHRIIDHEVSLQVVLERQADALESQIADLEKYHYICKKMLTEKEMTYDDLEVEAYVTELEDYWKSNSKVLRLDSVGFLYLWGGLLAWGGITAVCFLLALLAYPNLPSQVPIQWNNGEISRQIGKAFIFVYPAACIIIRFFLRQFIWRWLTLRLFCFSDTICDYVTNCLCFVILSVEAFTIFYVNGMMQNVTTILTADAVVLVGVLLIGWYKLTVGHARD